MKKITIIFLMLFLMGCGQSGSLYLPEAPSKEKS